VFALLRWCLCVDAGLFGVLVMAVCVVSLRLLECLFFVILCGFVLLYSVDICCDANSVDDFSCLVVYLWFC